MSSSVYNAIYDKHTVSTVFGWILLILGIMAFIYVTSFALGTPSCQAGAGSGSGASIFTCCGNCGEFWTYFLATIFIAIGVALIVNAHVITNAAQKLVNAKDVLGAVLIDPVPIKVVNDKNALPVGTKVVADTTAPSGYSIVPINSTENPDTTTTS